jgi:hypothetical protein
MTYLWKTWIIGAALLLSAACGSDDGGDEPGASGIAASTRVTALSDSEQQTLCGWIDEALAGQNETCGREPDREECLGDLDLPADCDATVADVEACIEALADAACDGADPAECAVFDACE